MKLKGNHRKEELQKERDIKSNEPRQDYMDNGISTSKYTFITFLPLNLMEQFSKMANIYFLFIGFMQMIQSISISEGKPVILFPLLVVVLISMAKDLLEDKKRHDSDKKENNDSFMVLRNGKFVKCSSQSILVGEVVKVEKGERVPADILCIYSSGKGGECFIETKNLDGETNLKKKLAPKLTCKLELNEIQTGCITFSYEPPNPYLYKFNGQVKIKGGSSAVNDNNFILRGCSLQNTELIYGLVAYTGHQTKIMLNSVKARPKKSKVEIQMNEFIALIFFLQMFFCFIAAVIAAVMQREVFYGLDYLQIGKESSGSGLSDQDTKFLPTFLIKWGTWILIFTNFVPISLLVTLEMVKYFQGKLISADHHTQSIDPDDPSIITNATVLSSSLNEELGQVQYIFSDKTGTLTSNIMKYKCATINGISYGEDNQPQTEEEILKAAADQSFLNSPHLQSKTFIAPKGVEQLRLSKDGSFGGPDKKVIKEVKSANNENAVKPYKAGAVGKREAALLKVENEQNSQNFKNNAEQKPSQQLNKFVDFTDERLFRELENTKSINYEYIFDFLLMLALCHTVVTEVDQKTQEIEYSASSPDEMALINFAKFIGMEFTGIDETDNMMIKFKKQSMKFKLLHVLEFNSTRKRMSVIVEDEEKQQIILYTKGADSIIQKRMAPCDNELLEQTWLNLSRYAQQGLRTLLCAKRIIPRNEYNKWAQLYAEASSALKDRDEKMMEVQELIEVNLVMLGATGIDDKLQDQVGETIKQLKATGIKVWVLTGDKVETAINIGYSCKLLSDNQQQIIIDGETDSQVLQSISEAEIKIRQSIELVDDPMNILALILTGDCLIPCAKNQFMMNRVMDIADKCEVVLACRVSPKQKQEIVAMVKKSKPGATTLAIGDGANDVNMITEAHVGIGIRGREGIQAARASDFAIGEFKILRNLLLYHGRECYRRNSALICYNFYKNMLLVLPQFWYGISNGFSGASLYDPWIYQLYNMCYTSIPIFIYAILDEEFIQEQLIQMPQEYQQGMNSLLFNKKQFLLWLLNGFWQAAICCWVNYLGMETSFNKRGRMVFFAACGNQSFGSSVIIGNLKILIFSYTHTPISLFCIIASIAFYLSNHAIASVFWPESDLWNTFKIQMQSPYFWFCNIVTVGFVFFIELGAYYIKFSLKYHQKFYGIQYIKSQQQQYQLQNKITNGHDSSQKYKDINGNTLTNSHKNSNALEQAIIVHKKQNNMNHNNNNNLDILVQNTPLFISPDSSCTLDIKNGALLLGDRREYNQKQDEEKIGYKLSKHFLSKTLCVDSQKLPDPSRSTIQNRTTTYTGYAFSKEEKFTEFRKNNYLN